MSGFVKIIADAVMQPFTWSILFLIFITILGLSLSVIFWSIAPFSELKEIRVINEEVEVSILYGGIVKEFPVSSIDASRIAAYFSAKAAERLTDGQIQLLTEAFIFYCIVQMILLCGSAFFGGAHGPAQLLIHFPFGEIVLLLISCLTAKKWAHEWERLQDPFKSAALKP